jgi:hypothetical protein
MTDRVLRSQTAGLDISSSTLSAGEEAGRLGTGEDSELGSLGEIQGISRNPVCETEVDPPHSVSRARVQPPAVSETNDLTQMLAGIMDAIQQTRDSLKEDLATNNEKLQANVRKELADNNEKLQENFRSEIDKIREQMKNENKALINRFDNLNKQTVKEFTGKLETKSRWLTNLVSQAQKETEQELVGFKRQLQTISSDLQEKLEQANSSTQVLIEELANQVEERQSEMNTKLQEVGQEVSSEIERQKEGNNQTTIEQKLELVSAKLVALENKVSEQRPAVVAEQLPDCHNNMPSPSGVVPRDAPVTAVQIDGNRACSCQSTTCQECMSSYNSSCRMNVGNTQQVSSFLSSSELPLPLFDESKENNPVCHIRQLDEFMQFRGIPKALQLAVAYRSMDGQMSKQWAETASWNLKEYQDFRRAFLRVWWSSSQQSLVKCRLYQGKYNRNSGLSLSAYFMQQATTASYLEPKLTDSEIVEAIRFHYPIHIQRAMLSNQLHSISEALDLLKRVEVMEASEGFQRPHQPAPQHNQNTRRQNQTGPHDQRAQPQGQVRQVQFRSPRRNNNNRNWRRWNNNQEQRQPSINPNAPTFQSSPQQASNSEN